ncbi:hypothetical protein AB5I41_26435 [Sphingomonas sp. MMS24-JH45]
MPTTDRRTFVTGAVAGAAAAAAPAAGQNAATALGAAAHPKPPFPVQRQPWPGLASKMDPRPDHGETSCRRAPGGSRGRRR